VTRVVIRNRMLTMFRVQVKQTNYTLNNKSDSEYVCYLDHARPPEWELYDTPAPFETTQNHWRFRFTLPAHKKGHFTVHQKYTSHVDHSLTDLNNQALEMWLQQRYFDAKTEEVLRAVVEQRQQAGRAEEQIVRLREERETIHNAQKRIRENLQSLGDRPAEKELRERFVRTLNAQEDRLEKIEQETAEQTAARDRCRAQINELLGRLEYDANL
jgi:hypothetical protein